MLISAIAMVTENLGFGLTRTLDHLTDGRMGWNIVTGYLISAAKGADLVRWAAHDTRYEIAEEYMEVVYKLWEASSEDDAAVSDIAAGVLTDPHKVQHNGENYRVDAVHLSEPSPQRSPVLYQAGASSKGRKFAACHAECVFIAGPSKQIVALAVLDIRNCAVQEGRDPSGVLMFTLMTVIPGRTDEEAQAKFAEYRACRVRGHWRGRSGHRRLTRACGRRTASLDRRDRD